MGKDNLYNLNDYNESSDKKVSNDQFIAKKRKKPFNHNQAKEKINTLSKSEYGQKYLKHIDKKIQELTDENSSLELDEDTYFSIISMKDTSKTIFLEKLYEAKKESPKKISSSIDDEFDNIYSKVVQMEQDIESETTRLSNHSNNETDSNHTESPNNSSPKIQDNEIYTIQDKISNQISDANQSKSSSDLNNSNIDLGNNKIDYNHEKACSYLEQLEEKLENSNKQWLKKAHNQIEEYIEILRDSYSFIDGFTKVMVNYNTDNDHNNFILVKLLEEFHERFSPNLYYTEEMHDKDIQHAFSSMIPKIEPSVLGHIGDFNDSE